MLSLYSGSSLSILLLVSWSTEKVEYGYLEEEAVGNLFLSSTAAASIFFLDISRSSLRSCISDCNFIISMSRVSFSTMLFLIVFFIFLHRAPNLRVMRVSFTLSEQQIVMSVLEFPPRASFKTIVILEFL